MHRDLEFTVESLEERKMMAGDVSVRVTSGGDLRIDGDSQDNEIRVSQHRIPDLGTGYRFEGINGTTVNGEDVFILLDASVVTDDFRINMRGGNNKLGIIGPDEFSHDVPFSVPDDIIIRSGSGNDVIYMEFVGVGDDISVRTGGGEDAIQLQIDTIADRVDVNSGSGNDHVAILGVLGMNRANVNTGTGDDTLVMAGVETSGDIRVNLGAGVDGMFAINSEFANGISLNGGSSNDLLRDTMGATTGTVDYGTGLVDRNLESYETVTGVQWLNAKAEQAQKTEADDALTDFLFDIEVI